MRILRIFFKSLIGLFCLWHMAAIGIYSLQNVDSQPILKWLEQQQYIVRPYVLMTSQWQRWNLFSPDPLRRVTFMSLQAQIGNDWRTVRTMDFDQFNYFRRASELKVLRRMDEDNQQELKEAYVQDICQNMHIPDGMVVRLQRRSQVIPKHDTPQSVAFWRSWQPQWNQDIILQTTCRHRISFTES